MIEIGHPFSKPFQELIDSLEESIREGVEQPAQRQVLFRRATPTYEIAGPVSGISRVTGLRRRQFVVFETGVHYRYSNNRLIWIEPANASDPDWYPDDNSWLQVEYTYRDLPSGITDFNAGSVAGTMARAVARELKFLYEQMDQAYRRAFIDIAQGDALDNVVALLGIARNQALPATGFVTFFLKKAPRSAVAIPPRTRVADAKGRIFLVREGGTIEPSMEERAFPSGGQVRTTNRIGELQSVRVRGAATAEPTTPTTNTAPYGPDERTITLASDVTDELVITYKPKSVTVPVVAMEPGPEGNLGSGSLTIMPTPPRGVDGGVTNENPTEGGEQAENDDQLRERAKHALERAGNATLTAIKYAILEVDGVEGVEVRDHVVDESIPLGEVRVRYSGGNEPDILRAIDRTRAAGIVVRAEAITSVFIAGTLYVVPDVGFTTASATALRTQVQKALDEMAIGEALYVRRFAALAYGIAGLADLAEPQLDFAKRRPGEALPFASGAVTDPLVVSPGELVRPDAPRLAVVALAGLRATGAYFAAAKRTELTIGVADAAATPTMFRAFTLNITVVVKARLKAEPDQPRQRICQVDGVLQFTSANSAVLQIPNAAILDAPGKPGFRLGGDGHEPQVEFQVFASAYPALQPATAPVDLTGIAP